MQNLQVSLFFFLYNKIQVIFLFVVFILTKESKEVPLEVHISKASRVAYDLERQGVKFRLDEVKYYHIQDKTLNQPA